MAYMYIEPRPDELWQSNTMILPYRKNPKRVNFEIRYLYETGKWYMSMFDVQSGETYFRYVPLLASTVDNPNNLWEPYWHKEIGFMVCLPVVDQPSSPDPSEKNLGEFVLLWGDGEDE